MDSTKTGKCVALGGRRIGEESRVMAAKDIHRQIGMREGELLE